MQDDEINPPIDRDKINGETATIPWRELQRFFAQGVTLAVSPELDLVEVALQFSLDEKTVVEGWLEQGKVSVVSDQQAREWYEANAVVWSVVVRPWVLVQSR